MHGWETDTGVSFRVNDFVVVNAGTVEGGLPVPGGDKVGLVTSLAFGTEGQAALTLRMYVPAPLVNPEEYLRRYPGRDLAHWLLQTQ
jgi:hypothetical protein